MGPTEFFGDNDLQAFKKTVLGILLRAPGLEAL
jgi:hypothetical protein